METAMQLHIEDLEKTKMIMDGLHNVDSTTLTAIQSCIDNAKHYLAKEKEQIERAYKNPYRLARVHPGNNMNKDFEQYWNETYNTKRKPMNIDNNAKSTNAEQPAFPNFLQEGLSANSHVEVGLTKREYFAAMAMQGMLAGSETNIDTTELVKQAVKLSDALLEQLKVNQ